MREFNFFSIIYAWIEFIFFFCRISNKKLRSPAFLRKTGNRCAIKDDFDEKSLKKNSPFRIYYYKLIKKYMQNIKQNLSTNDNQVLNDYYCPMMFNIILDYIHVLPFWSGIMIGHWTSLNPKFKSITRLSNNPVENWFNQVKTHMNPDRPIMPSVFASRMSQRCSIWRAL